MKEQLSSGVASAGVARLSGAPFPFEAAGVELPKVCRAAPSEIEARLSEIPRGGMVIVDTNSNVHTARDSVLSAHLDAHVTIVRGYDNKFTVHDGLPSRNGVKVAGSYSNVSGSIVIPEGTEVQLAALKFVLPTSAVPNVAPVDLLLNDIRMLEVGQRIVIGRHPYEYLDFATSVSRVHGTIERQPDFKAEDGAVTRTYRVTDGRPSPLGVFIEGAGEGDLTRLHSPQSFGAGVRIRLGEMGPTFQLPEPRQKDPGENVENIHQSLLSVPNSEKFAARLVGQELSVGDFSMAHERTCFMQNPAVDFGDKLRVTPIQASVLGIHIREGLKLIREERYAEAMSHFEQKSILEFCGFRYEGNHYFQLQKLTGTEVRRVLDRIAADSWFKTDQLLVYPSYGEIKPGLVPQNETEAQLLKDFRREVGLLQGEEWTHAYQRALGKYVSKKGVLIAGGYGHEVDVALFFAEQRVPMSYTFLNERYPERQKEIDRLKGFQRPEEVAAVRQILSVMAPNESLIVGRKSSWGEVSQGPGVPRKFSIELGDDRAEHRGELSASHVMITKQPDGKRLIRDGGDNRPSRRHVYATDEYGIWRQVEKLKIVEAGSQIRLGKYYQLSV